ncbi:endoglucanase 3 [Hordeum vulgare]|nr:endoglucanase 3 [Hordeum vulgare]
MIQYFIDGCRDGTLLKHKLMCREPSTLAQLMAVVDQYAVAESSKKLHVLVDAVGKPTAPKPAAAPAAGRSQPNPGKRKADQPKVPQNSRQVAAMEDGCMADGPGPSRSRRTNEGKQPWHAKYTFEDMLDGPCKFHSGAKPATHTARQCNSFTRIARC